MRPLGDSQSHVQGTERISLSAADAYDDQFSIGRTYAAGASRCWGWDLVVLVVELFEGYSGARSVEPCGVLGGLQVALLEMLYSKCEKWLLVTSAQAYQAFALEPS